MENKIKDNYLKFWFSYVYPYQSYLEIENLLYPLEKIKNEFNLWVSKIYEDLARKTLLNNSEISFPIKKLGRWWNNNEEIDIVGLGDNEIIFGECKWSNKKVGLSVLLSLKEKSKSVKWNNSNRKEYFILFSKEGFSDDLIDLSKKDKTIILSEF